MPRGWTSLRGRVGRPRRGASRPLAPRALRPRPPRRPGGTCRACSRRDRRGRSSRAERITTLQTGQITSFAAGQCVARARLPAAIEAAIFLRHLVEAGIVLEDESVGAAPRARPVAPPSGPRSELGSNSSVASSGSVMTRIPGASDGLEVVAVPTAGRSVAGRGRSASRALLEGGEHQGVELPAKRGEVDLAPVGGRGRDVVRGRSRRSPCGVARRLEDAREDLGFVIADRFAACGNGRRRTPCDSRIDVLSEDRRLPVLERLTSSCSRSLELRAGSRFARCLEGLRLGVFDAELGQDPMEQHLEVARLVDGTAWRGRSSAWRLGAKAIMPLAPSSAADLADAVRRTSVAISRLARRFVRAFGDGGASGRDAVGVLVRDSPRRTGTRTRTSEPPRGRHPWRSRAWISIPICSDTTAPPAP